VPTTGGFGASCCAQALSAKASSCAVAVSRLLPQKKLTMKIVIGSTKKKLRSFTKLLFEKSILAAALSTAA